MPDSESGSGNGARLGGQKAWWGEWRRVCESTARVRALIAIFPIAFGCAASPEQVALVVGNARYEYATPLANPENDARAIAAELTESGWAVALAVDLPRDDLVALVGKMENWIQDADRVLLYYAGHGMQIDGRNYLVPIDFDPNRASLDLSRDLFQLSTVLSALKTEQNQVVVLLDACRNNPLAEQLQDSITRGLRLKVERKAPMHIGRGLAEMNTDSGTFIAFATEPGSVALDGRGRHSPFAQGLIRHLGTPEQDIGWILKRVRSDVLRETAGDQTPWDHSSLIDDFPIKQRKQTSPPP